MAPSAGAAVKACIEAFGSLNVALLNAGVNKPRMIMNINAKGVLLGMQKVARQMIAQGPMEDHPYKIIPVGSIMSRTAFLST